MLDIPSYIDYVKYLLVLLHVFSSHSKTVYKIIKAFSEYTILVQQSDDVLQKLGLTTEQITLLRKPNWNDIERELAWASQSNQCLITFFASEYPSLLREIYAPPLLLFVKGNKKILGEVQLAVVGSRNPTPQGVENSYALAKDLVAEGFNITSGLALGIDAAAHRGALAAQGKTIAVMGAGLDHIYPRQHKNLAQEIVDNGGVLLSEFPLSCAPLAGNFPQRNRIISGLSLGTIVVEATLRSGSLITAHLAAEQGREVFALPGSIHNPLTHGCHELIRQGAKLVENAEDVLAELPLSALENKTKNTNINNVGAGDSGVEFVATLNENRILGLAQIYPSSLGIPRGGEERATGVYGVIHDCREQRSQQSGKPKCEGYTYRKLLQSIDDTATHLDTIVARSSLTIKEIMSMLLHLELHGLVQKVTGGYVRVHGKK